VLRAFRDRHRVEKRTGCGRQAVAEQVATHMHFDGKKLIREWAGADKLALFIQLGVVDSRWPSYVTG
jgi:hypothetical protein